MRSWQVWEPRPIPSCALSTTVSSRRLAPTQDAGEAEGPRPSFRAGGSGQPFQETGPQGLTARGQLGRGGAEVGREPVSSRSLSAPRSSQRGDAHASRVGAVLAVPPSRFVRVYSDISLGASLPPRRAVILHP